MKNKISKTVFKIILVVMVASFFGCTNTSNNNEVQCKHEKDKYFQTSKPCVYWWWFATEIKESDVRHQLVWLKENGFGGVLIMPIYPYGRNRNDTVCDIPRDKWLSDLLSGKVKRTKQIADSLGLNCGFTYGTGWPFGGSHVEKEDATQIWTEEGISYFKTFHNVSWEFPKRGYVMDHLNKESFSKYSDAVGNIFKGTFNNDIPVVLSCDSWEIAEFEPIWTKGFDSIFFNRFGYDIKPYMDSIYVPRFADYRYDYLSVVSDLIVNNCYSHFTDICHEKGAKSMVECCGSPSDIISAYASVDIPFSEAMLFEPNYSKIPASAACLSSKNAVSAETFTCVYGFPDEYAYEEQTADLKLVADAMFANGVNQVYWHGFPYNPEGVDSMKYYATVHVSPKSKMAGEFLGFNGYMEKVSDYMKKGHSYSDVAVYLPKEDRWMAGFYSKDYLSKLSREERMWHSAEYQNRYEYMPEELTGYRPLWINHDFLEKAVVENNLLKVGDASFSSIYIDSKFLDFDALTTIHEIAKKGFPICIKQQPKQPGIKKNPEFEKVYGELIAMENVTDQFVNANQKPLVEGESLPEFWSRVDGDTHYIFFAHPKSSKLVYPIAYGQAFSEETIEIDVTINIGETQNKVTLAFKPYQSLMLKVTASGELSFEDIEFIPATPIVAEKN